MSAIKTNVDNLGYFNPPNVYRPAILSIGIVGEYDPSSGATNTYRIIQNDGKVFLFPVKNGADAVGIASVSVQESTEESGVSVMTISLTNGEEKIINIKNGTGISDIVQTVESEEPGGDNIIKITLTDGREKELTVRNGVSITGITENMSPEDGGMNDIIITLSDGRTYTLHTTNGHHGEPAVAVEDYYTAEATAQTTAVTDVLPATGAANTLYRVGSWNGTQYSASTYSVYGWYNSAYKLLEVHQVGIDDEPTADSQNLVKSGGVAKKISQLGQYVDRFTFDGAGDAVVSHIISGIIPNRTYRLQFDKVWDFTPSSVSTTAAIMEIVGYRNEVGTTLLSLPISRKADLLQSYDITNSGDYDYIRISIRANVGTNIDLCVSDVTNESPGYVLERGKFDAGYFQLCGYIRTDGDIAGFTDGISVHGSTFVKVIPGDSFSIENPDSLLIGYARYGANKAFISTAWFGSPTEIIIPADCYYIRLMARLSNGLTPATFGTKYILLSRNSISLVKGWILTEAYTINSVTRDADGNVTAASVVWPDSKTGTLTITRDSDGNVTQEVASYNGSTYTINITRDANGNVTSSSIS